MHTENLVNLTKTIRLRLYFMAMDLLNCELYTILTFKR